MKVESSVIQNKYLRVQTLNYGASLYEVFHKSKKINLILNLGSKKNYRFKHPSVGSTCGRYAGRISNSKFQISKEKYILSTNEGKNTLHGGKTGFSKLPWKKIKQTSDKIVYQLYSPNNDQGFPGNLIVICTYHLKNKFLNIKYDYKSDKKTHVNLTNHSYWNLEKDKKQMIYNHELKLNSNKYLQVNKNLIPTGKIMSVKNSVYNFLKFQNIKKKLSFFENKEIDIKHKGFDTTYIVKKNSKNFIGFLKNNNSKIQISFFSNLPSVQLYTAQNLNYKKKLFPYQGICLETQYFPDTPNKKNFPTTLIKANKRYICFTKIKIN
ncbi:galactose mutarotase [Candidatus Pelagibacter bacterium]|nr:galactose mutarotase [Candidatus Pelagibacter bacterium]